MSKPNIALVNSDIIESSPLDLRLGALMLQAGVLSKVEAETVRILLHKEDHLHYTTVSLRSNSDWLRPKM